MRVSYFETGRFLDRHDAFVTSRPPSVRRLRGNWPRKVWRS
jgi:hypothetical protein